MQDDTWPRHWEDYLCIQCHLLPVEATVGQVQKLVLGHAACTTLGQWSRMRCLRQYGFPTVSVSRIILSS
eukprot:3161867-Amphidinium_carterae.1